MTLDEVLTHIVRVENLILHTRELIAATTNPSEAQCEYMNLIHFERTLSQLVAHREFLLME
jgi:hypothetical protein